MASNGVLQVFFYYALWGHVGLSGSLPQGIFSLMNAI